MMLPAALPESARIKLSDLQLARMTAEDAARAANVRLNSLPRDSSPELVRGLTAERDKHNERQRALALLIGRINQWIVEQKRPLQLAPAVDGIKLKRDETLHDALTKVREQITALHQHIAAVKSSPLPLADQEQIAEAYVVKLLAAARPAVAIMRDDQLRVTFRDSVVASTDDVLALLCWCCPEQVFKALVRAIHDQPARADAMPAAERVRRVAELESQLLELELLEEAIILRAHGDGLDILRRPDAAPAAVLGVVLAKTEVKVA
jgi:hypothetical protein